MAKPNHNAPADHWFLKAPRLNRTFLHSFLVIWGILGLCFVLVGSNDFMLAVQYPRAELLDGLMLIWTQLGEAHSAILLFFALYLIYRKQDQWKTVRNAFILSVLLAAIVPQGLKWIFADCPRPWALFPDVKEIPGLTKSNYKSFPSGHTAFATALAALWASLAPNKFQYPILLAVLAFGVGYSRIHLHMHWLHDVLAGGLVGLICTYFGLRHAEFTQTS